MEGFQSTEFKYVIFCDGNIITMDDGFEERPPPEALAIKVSEGKILGVGTLQEMLALCDMESKQDHGTTKIVSLEGRTLMPGFIEPHMHATMLPPVRQGNSFVDINGYEHETYEEVNEVIKATIKTKQEDSDTTAVLFSGWDPETVPNMPPLSAEDIDKNFSPGEIPVVILGQSYHIAWANMKALNNVPEAIKQDKHFIRNDHGQLTGQVFETTAIRTILEYNSLQSTMTKEDVEERWLLCANAGVTTITDLFFMKDFAGKIVKSVSETPDDYRLRLFMYEIKTPKTRRSENSDECCRPNKVPQTSANTKAGDNKDCEPEWTKKDFLEVIGIKIIADGSPHCGTMAVRHDEPYLESEMTKLLGFPPAPCTGALNCTKNDMFETVSKAHREGKQVAIHAHGERAIDQVLDVYEALENVQDCDVQVKDSRHRIEHLGLATEEHIKRAARLNLALSFFVNHLFFYATTFKNAILGPARTDRWAPCSLATANHLHWTLHQDHPAHPGHVMPLLSMKTAVTRTERGNREIVYGPDYRVTIEEALKAYTINAAWQLRRDHILGSLTPGKYADLVVLSDNPRQVSPFDLDQIKVCGTFVAGKLNKLWRLEQKDEVYIIIKKNNTAKTTGMQMSSNL